jgi:hypothetical protein
MNAERKSQYAYKIARVNGLFYSQLYPISKTFFDLDCDEGNENAWGNPLDIASGEWNLVAANLKHIEANLADAHGLVDAEFDDGNVVVGAG